MSQNGKGSRQRPKSVSQKTWDKNWENIFGKKDNNSKKVSSVVVDKPIRQCRMKLWMREFQSSD